MTMARGRYEEVRGLYAIVDTDLVGPIRAVRVAEALVEAGAGVLQLRAKTLQSGDFLALARRLRDICYGRGALFIVNDRVDVAIASGASGVHLGQDDIPVLEARRLLGREMVIGLSTHSLEQARLAGDTSADYISFGPVYPTSTKKDAEPALGLEALGKACSLVTKPLVAIGGITEDRLPGVLATGVEAVAMISHILLDRDPASKARRIMGMMERK